MYEPLMCTIPANPDLLAVVTGAAAKAEAAQARLAAEMADEASERPQLARVLETYSTVQRRYHQGLLQLVADFGPLASSPAGIAYTAACEALEQKSQLQPGDSIPFKELQDLAAAAVHRADAGGGGGARLPLLAWVAATSAEVAGVAAACEEFGALRQQTQESLVLPDLLTALTVGCSGTVTTLRIGVVAKSIVGRASPFAGIAAAVSMVAGSAGVPLMRKLLAAACSATGGVPPSLDGPRLRAAALRLRLR